MRIAERRFDQRAVLDHPRHASPRALAIGLIALTGPRLFRLLLRNRFAAGRLDGVS